jgi:hypothetical protein
VYRTGAGADVVTTSPKPPPADVPRRTAEADVVRASPNPAAETATRATPAREIDASPKPELELVAREEAETTVVETASNPPVCTARRAGKSFCGAGNAMAGGGAIAGGSRMRGAVATTIGASIGAAAGGGANGSGARLVVTNFGAANVFRLVRARANRLFGIRPGGATRVTGPALTGADFMA